MARMRTFIAIDIPPSLQRELVHLQELFRAKGADIRWVQPAQMHITLRFLGEIEAERLPQVVEAAQKATEGINPFIISLEGIGRFPAHGLPRVLWVGIGQGRQELQVLWERLETELRLRNFPGDEDRDFKAHVTLGRFRSPGGWEKWKSFLEAEADRRVGSFRAENIWVVRSDLLPHGPRYTQLGSISLANS